MSAIEIQPEPDDCEESCRITSSFEDLNRACRCITLDEAALRLGLERELESRGLSQAMVETHPHLFSPVPLFVSRQHLERMASVVSAVEHVVVNSSFQEAALQWAPPIASHDPETRGGMLGYDFHLGAEGPQLIEINTNPGGLLLSAIQGRAQRSCCRDVANLATVPTEAEAIEDDVFEVFMVEWRQRRGTAPLHLVAIVDQSPDAQYLYPEFLLYRHLFARRGIEPIICDPADLVRHDGRLWRGRQAVDLVYNRLTDFSLEASAHESLRLAYLADEVVVSPHPRAHALYADKRNLTLLGNEAFLRRAGIVDEEVEILRLSVPRTELVTSANRDGLWARRRELFFKPASGYGSKAAYRGDKLTKRVWQEMSAATYVAQDLIVPGERQVSDAHVPVALKADIRNFAYAGLVRHVAARLYQGQTTNFRTPAGGFAPVFTEAA